jgi:succinate dehydrogenase / fumarate reductase, cytochrome b subunit
MPRGEKKMTGSNDNPHSARAPNNEAAGRGTPNQVATAMREDLNVRSVENERRVVQTIVDRGGLGPRTRPLSPNIQIYRPQLTSVLSIANRITGIVLGLGSVCLVAWLVAAASGPETYVAVQGTLSSWIGQLVLFGFTFAFFLHFCGGIRHLVWDTVHAFDLRSIYLGGWTVIAASMVLTAVAWVAGFFLMTGYQQ